MACVAYKIHLILTVISEYISGCFCSAATATTNWVEWINGGWIHGEYRDEERNSSTMQNNTKSDGNGRWC